MSPSSRTATRRTRTVRRTAKRRKSGGVAGRVGRYAVGGVLVALLLLFLASVLGLLGRRGPREGDAVAADGWRIPSQLLGQDADQGHQRGSATSEFATQVARLEGEVRRPEAGADGALQPTSSARLDGPPPVRVYLTNGCGVDRLAATLTPLLREAGFDVCGCEDADRGDYTETLVIDRCGDRRRAQAVCDFFHARWGVGRVLLQARGAAETDVLVIVGRDIGDRFRAKGS